MGESIRPAWAYIDLSVVTENARLLSDAFAPAELCAVVKADGYGHGSAEVAHAALAGGAKRVAVALVEEGRLLREQGITAPILLLSEPSPLAMREVVVHDITPTLYTVDGVRALASETSVSSRTFPVHIKVDTGMHRVGADPATAAVVIDEVLANPTLRWEGLWTHFAVADEPENEFTQTQVERFDVLIERLADVYELPPLLHSSNTAGGLTLPSERRSLVRCGIGVYGVPPSAAVDLPTGVFPAMSVRTQVTYVKRLESGAGISYGQDYVLDRPATIATIPLGYADGIPLVLSSRGAQVLIRGKRHRMAGRVTMDQITIDCGDTEVEPGDEVVLIGTQGGETITANEWGRLAETIGYEVVCRIGPRLPRRYVGATGTFRN